MVRACLHSKNLTQKVGADWLIFVATGREKPGGERIWPLGLNGVNQTHRGHTLVLYFRGKCTPLSLLSKVLSLEDTPIDCQGDIEFFKKILMLSKITLPLHRFIKKFLKNIPAPYKFHSQSPSTQIDRCVPQKSQANGRRSKLFPRGLLFVFTGKCVTIVKIQQCTAE